MWLRYAGHTHAASGLEHITMDTFDTVLCLKHTDRLPCECVIDCWTWPFWFIWYGVSFKQLCLCFVSRVRRVNSEAQPLPQRFPNPPSVSALLLISHYLPLHFYDQCCQHGRPHEAPTLVVRLWITSPVQPAVSTTGDRRLQQANYGMRRR